MQGVLSPGAWGPLYRSEGSRVNILLPFEKEEGEKDPERKTDQLIYRAL